MEDSAAAVTTTSTPVATKIDLSTMETIDLESQSYNNNSPSNLVPATVVAEAFCVVDSGRDDDDDDSSTDIYVDSNVASNQKQQATNVHVVDHQADGTALCLLISGAFFPIFSLLNVCMHYGSQSEKANRFARISGVLLIFQVILSIILLIVAFGSASTAGVYHYTDDDDYYQTTTSQSYYDDNIIYSSSTGSNYNDDVFHGSITNFNDDVFSDNFNFTEYLDNNIWDDDAYSFP